jgi:hypothetical protein
MISYALKDVSALTAKIQNESPPKLSTPFLRILYKELVIGTIHTTKTIKTYLKRI